MFGQVAAEYDPGMASTPVVAAVVPAAGRSERFGSMKLVADVGGVPLLDRTLASLLDAGLARIVVVVAPDAALDVVSRLHDPSVRRVVNPNPTRGMFSSIQCGLRESGAYSTVVLPGDMPFVRPETVRIVADRCARLARVVIAARGGRRGHPIGIPARLIAALTSADSMDSLKSALAALGEDPVLVEVEDDGVVRDVDWPGDLN